MQIEISQEKIYKITFSSKKHFHFSEKHTIMKTVKM